MRDLSKRTYGRKQVRRKLCSINGRLNIDGQFYETCRIHDLTPFGAGLYLPRLLNSDASVCLGYSDKGKDERLLVPAKVVWQRLIQETIRGVDESYNYRIGLEFKNDEIAGFDFCLKVSNEVVMMASNNYVNLLRFLRI